MIYFSYHSLVNIDLSKTIELVIIYYDNEYINESIIECLFSLHNVRYQIIFADK